jgi:hypothetical protein
VRWRQALATGAVAVLVAGAATRAGAQESIFSLHFLGISEETGDVRARSQGILGIALPETQSAVVLNPAAHAWLSRMTLSVMGLAGQRTSEDAARQDTQGLARFPHARFALPLPGDVVLSAGFLGLRNFRSEFQLPARSVTGLPYQQSFERGGTLYTMPVGLARAIGSRVQLGVTLDFVLGTVDEAWTTSGDSLVALRTRRRDTFSGRSATVGAVVRPWPALRIGATVSPSVKIDRSARTTIEDARIASGDNALRDTTVLSEVRFPATWRAGASFDVGSHWTVAADALRRDWADYDGRLYEAEGVGLESRVGGGVEFRPQRPQWWGRLAYRAGVSRTTWPQRVGGQRLRETTVHVGTGFDLKGGFGRLDLGFEYGRAGSLASNGHHENSWRFLLGLSGQETWRRRSPRTPTRGS